MEDTVEDLKAVVTAERGFGIGNVALTQAELNTLFAGNNPMSVRPDNLLIYLPLRSNLQNLGVLRSQQPAAVGGAFPTFTAHPPVSAPPPRRFFLKHTGGSTYSGSVTETGSASDALAAPRLRFT